MIPAHVEIKIKELAQLAFGYGVGLKELIACLRKHLVNIAYEKTGTQRLSSRMLGVNRITIQRELAKQQ